MTQDRKLITAPPSRWQRLCNWGDAFMSDDTASRWTLLYRVPLGFAASVAIFGIALLLIILISLAYEPFLKVIQQATEP